MTTSAVASNNTVTFSTLSAGSHSNCTVVVTDTAGNASNPLAISAFVIDTTAPTLFLITPIPTLTNDNSPNYTFSSDEAGSISYGGDCISGTLNALVGSNTVTLFTLSDGTHSNCTVNVADGAGNSSTSLNFDSFTIDTTAPALVEITSIATSTNDTTPNYTFNSDEAGSISYGGDCISGTLNATIGNNLITFDILNLGLHNNCTIAVIDEAGNNSNILNITDFTITTPSLSPTPTQSPTTIPTQSPTPIPSPTTTPTPTPTQSPTTTQNSDEDNIPDSVENSAPNKGDGNNDGTPDNKQSNVVSIADDSGKFITVVTPINSAIIELEYQDPNEFNNDTSFNFIQDLINVSVKTDQGSIIPIEFFIFTTKFAQDLIPKEYNIKNNKFSVIPESILSDSNIGTEHIVKLFYKVKDGSNHDQDMIENGKIINTVGIELASVRNNNFSKNVITKNFNNHISFNKILLLLMFISILGPFIYILKNHRKIHSKKHKYAIKFKK